MCRRQKVTPVCQSDFEHHLARNVCNFSGSCSGGSHVVEIPEPNSRNDDARTTLAFLAVSAFTGAAHAQQPPKAKVPPASQQQSAKPAPPDRAKCIGVASAIGDAFYLRKIGITVFNNESEHVPIESWQIDDLVINKLSSFLRKNWAVRRISYAKGAFGVLDGNHPLFFNYEEELRGIVRGIASSTPCDHHVVVVKGASPYSNTNQSLYGLGMLELGAPLRTGEFIYALYSIRVYDGQNFALLGRRDAVIEEPNILTAWMKPIHGPHAVVDTSWRPDAGAAPGPMVRDGIRSLVEKGLDVTMPMILSTD
jgi:hypothetical protein